MWLPSNAEIAIQLLSKCIWNSFRGKTQLFRWLKAKAKLHPHLAASGCDGAFHTGKQKAEELSGHTKSHLLPKARGIWVPDLSSTVVSLHSRYLRFPVLDEKLPQPFRDPLQPHWRQCQQQAGCSPQALVCHTQVSCLHISLIFRTSLSTGEQSKVVLIVVWGFFLASL